LSIRVRLVLASTLMLFLELSLIRWSGAQVVHLSYFSNFILLGSFLGIGLGFLRASRSKRRQPVYSIVALLAYVGFLSRFPVAVNRDQEAVIYFTSLSTSGPPIWVTLPVIFLAVAAIMAGPGELVADCFYQLPRLDAYRCDLIGSLIGIAGFTVCAFTGAPPLVWFLLVATLFVVLLDGPGRIVTITVLAATVAMFAYPLINASGVFWSPYYRVTTFAQSDGNNGTQWRIYVNGVPHQRLTTAATRLEQEPFYDEPYRRVTKPPQHVLIVGAGTGTDVSIALSHGVAQVDAVEIDPQLVRFGREHNPDRAYDDPRVTTYVDDGRAFLERTDKKYDLILFALPDSLTLVSGASALRLESYLFTKEAIQSARQHLAPGGVFSMYNYYREQWLVDRLGNTLAITFGHSPCLLSSPEAISLAVFAVGMTPADQQCDTTWSPTGTPPQPSTDDRPFLYVAEDTGFLGIPTIYLTAIGLIVLFSVLAVAISLTGGVGQVRTMWQYRDLFLLGIAFLLLETKSVTGFALYFGTTWLVNALVFAGVLVAVLAAVEITRRFRTPPLRLMYFVLFGSLTLAWLVPASWVLSLPFPARLVVAVLLAFLPIMAANIIFAKRFESSAHPVTAFGTNLLGAMIGGCLEYAALATGYRWLLVICACLYLAAYLTMPRGSDRRMALGSPDGQGVLTC
jgi:SAM-dependent methyltransferase